MPYQPFTSGRPQMSLFCALAGRYRSAYSAPSMPSARALVDSPAVCQILCYFYIQLVERLDLLEQHCNLFDGTPPCILHLLITGPRMSYRSMSNLANCRTRVFGVQDPETCCSVMMGLSRPSLMCVDVVSRKLDDLSLTCCRQLDVKHFK